MTSPTPIAERCLTPGQLRIAKILLAAGKPVGHCEVATELGYKMRHKSGGGPSGGGWKAKTQLLAMKRLNLVRCDDGEYGSGDTFSLTDQGKKLFQKTQDATFIREFSKSENYQS